MYKSAAGKFAARGCLATARYTQQTQGTGTETNNINTSAWYETIIIALNVCLEKSLSHIDRFAIIITLKISHIPSRRWK